MKGRKMEVMEPLFLLFLFLLTVGIYIFPTVKLVLPYASKELIDKIIIIL
jgi:hypothetical protein